MNKEKIGFIGLGHIGKPTAMRLLQPKFEVFVHDLDEAAMDELAKAGAKPRARIAELAEQCRHIGICVRDDRQVEAVLMGEGGIFAHAPPDTLIAVHSTVTQANILRWAAEASSLGLHLLDAPLTGGPHKAAAGTLCYMVGGPPELVERCRPVLATSAEKIVHAGQTGTGIALKLANNFIQYGEFVLMAEATRFAEACGLDSDKLREVGLSNGVVNEQMQLFIAGRNGVLQSAGDAQMEAFFGALGRLGRKDLECALSTAQEKDVKLPTAEYVCERIERVFLAQDESRPADT